MRYEDILYFWFVEAGPEKWWSKSKAFDDLACRKYKKTYDAALRGTLQHWRASMRGRMAEIIVLDQFSRNMFRNDARAFQGDILALALSQEAARQPAFYQLTPEERNFTLLPHMHSESIEVHEQVLPFYDAPDMLEFRDFEVRHKEIIERFGRYPHRNAVLGRISTAEERAFLKQPGSSF